VKAVWKTTKSAWKKLRDHVPRWLEVATMTIAVLVFCSGVVTKALDLFEHHKPVDVELGEIAVTNPRLEYSEAGAAPESEPTVTATVRNRGGSTAWVDEARVTVLDGTQVPVCFTQGGGPDVPYSKPYRVMLPEYPNAERRVIRHELHVEVQPGHGARPLLRFAKRLTATTGIYAIDVRFVIDPGKEILDAGRFVIAVPGPFPRGGFDFFLPENEAALTNREFPRNNPDVSWCLRHNIAGVRRLAADPGRRSPEVKALSHLRLARSWPAVADHDSPREAVAALLASEDRDSAMWAVEAAATVDKAYEEEVRKRAVAILIGRAEEDLDTSASSSVADVERALSLERSDAGRKLLAEAKIASTEQEERLQAEMAAEDSTVASGSGG